MSFMCKQFRQLLFHFTVIMARSILLPLVNKKSKVRIAALDALTQILHCGIWKYNNDVMEILIGFRDPNTVPIKDFFEATTRFNYMGLLVKDAKPNVRSAFIRTVGDWLLNLPDHVDHEPRLVPYIVSGNGVWGYVYGIIGI